MDSLNSEFDYIILDLDNTLYDEYNFIELCISDFLIKINYNDIKINNWKKDFRIFYKKNGNNKIFDNFIQNRFDVSKIYLNIFLSSLRNENLNSLDILMFPGVKQFLNLFQNKISIVTDGNIKQQIKKIKILKLETFISKDKIFCSDIYNGKSTEEFKLFITEELKINKTARGIVIGDNPKSDGVLAKNLNFQYYNINENNSFFRKYM
tara:strand:- start:9874 stop:10497 length:624 start_codon:yes stop_codon:yes gene_type:complete